ncbi:MAG TPA: alpha/beta fold hydrolase [Haliangium sp.]|nr:alpha/beta fold hydrolase [Haliangium sp.]
MNELEYFPDGTRMEEARLPSGLRMRWYERGPASATVVLCLHGWPELAVSWRHQLDGLGDRWRVVAPDMRGYGGTDAPARVADYRMPHLCRDVAELIEVLGNERVHLVGHDWGGAVAWEFARQRPDRLRTLSVLNCPPTDMLAREVLRNPRQLRRSWYMFMFQLPRFPEWLLGRDPARSMARVFRGAAGQRDVFTREALAPYVRHARERGVPGIHYYRAAMPPSRTPAPIEVPTRLIWGLGDRALGPWFAEPERYRAFVRDFDRVVIEEAGHWVQQEAPERVNAALAEHIERGWERH